MEQETLLLVFKFLHTFIIQCWIASNRFGKFFIYPSCQYFLQGKIQFLLSWAILKILLMTAWVPQFNDVHTSSCFNRNNVLTTQGKDQLFPYVVTLFCQDDYTANITTWVLLSYAFTLMLCHQLSESFRPRPHVSGYFWIRATSKISPSIRSVLKSNSPAHTHPMVSGFTLKKQGLHGVRPYSYIVR